MALVVGAHEQTCTCLLHNLGCSDRAVALLHRFLHNQHLLLHSLHLLELLLRLFNLIQMGLLRFRRVFKPLMICARGIRALARGLLRILLELFLVRRGRRLDLRVEILRHLVYVVIIGFLAEERRGGGHRGKARFEVGIHGWLLVSGAVRHSDIGVSLGRHRGGGEERRELILVFFGFVWVGTPLRPLCLLGPEGCPKLLGREKAPVEPIRRVGRIPARTSGTAACRRGGSSASGQRAEHHLPVAFRSDREVSDPSG
mmetsp:Transcript_41841/g.67222  ORF Transcript_41841/g.67222 Transcript_41841/m.67222 type:complete len:257 (-) Transcript_41841:310-1080(-)